MWCSYETCRWALGGGTDEPRRRPALGSWGVHIGQRHSKTHSDREEPEPGRETHCPRGCECSASVDQRRLLGGVLGSNKHNKVEEREVDDGDSDQDIYKGLFILQSVKLRPGKKDSEPSSSPFFHSSPPKQAGLGPGNVLHAF